MKYLTKEWLKRVNLSDLYFDLEINSSAEEKSENLFVHLYERKEQEYLKEARDEHKFDPLSFLTDIGYNPKEMDPKVLSIDLSDEEAEFMRDIVQGFDNRKAFDEELAKKYFAENYQYDLAQIKSDLPASIYEQIADPRVFVLGYCSESVYTQLRLLSTENERYTEEVLDQYYAVMSEQDIPDRILDVFDFQNSKITGWLSQGKDLVLSLDNTDSYGVFERIIFYDVEILLSEDLLNLYWTYDELYRLDNGYEFHLLCSGDRISELILRCSDIKIEEV